MYLSLNVSRVPLSYIHYIAIFIMVFFYVYLLAMLLCCYVDAKLLFLLRFLSSSLKLASCYVEKRRLTRLDFVFFRLRGLYLSDELPG